MMLNTSLINWQKVDGLLPVIVQHAQSGQVLMLGYMNNEALAKTINESKVTFYSRTKQRLWTKGGNLRAFFECRGYELGL